LLVIKKKKKKKKKNTYKKNASEGGSQPLRLAARGSDRRCRLQLATEKKLFI
jgi:hypothetical protein